MNVNEREAATVSAFLEALAEVYAGPRIEPLARIATARRFLVHVSAIPPLSGRILHFAISDSSLAVFTAGGRYMDREHALKHLREHDVIERMDAGEEVMV